MKKIVLVLIFFSLVATCAFAQDVLTVARTNTYFNGISYDPAYVAVSLRDVSGTLLGADATTARQIRGLSFFVTYSASEVSSISFERAGVLLDHTPLYERTVIGSGTLAYVALFSSTEPLSFTSNAAAPGDRIGTLKIQMSVLGSMTLTVDPTRTLISNAAGNLFETRFNHQLQVVSGSANTGGVKSTTTLTVSPNPANEGQAVLLRAEVSAADGAPTGTITFREHDTQLGSANVQGGVGSITLSTLTAGQHNIYGYFEGDATHSASPSNGVLATIVHVVDAPTNINAIATGTNSVSVSWTAVAGATSYEVRRSVNHGSYTLVGSPSTNAFVDNTAQPNTTYLYVVRARKDAASSPDSSFDAATTVMFTDDPLLSSVTTKAAHLSELRTAVNAFRAAAGLPAASFTDPAPLGIVIRKVQMTELRSAITEARSALGLSTPAFTDATLTPGVTQIRAAHFQEIRSLLK